MEDFINKLQNHIEHVKRVGEHCSTEETTKQALMCAEKTGGFNLVN